MMGLRIELNIIGNLRRKRRSAAATRMVLLLIWLKIMNIYRTCIIIILRSSCSIRISIIVVFLFYLLIYFSARWLLSALQLRQQIEFRDGEARLSLLVLTLLRYYFAIPSRRSPLITLQKSLILIPALMHRNEIWCCGGDALNTFNLKPTPIIYAIQIPPTCSYVRVISFPSEFAGY